MDKFCPLILIIADTTISQAASSENFRCQGDNCQWFISLPETDEHGCAVEFIANGLISLARK